MARSGCCTAGWLAWLPAALFAQGQDSLPAERNLMIVAQALPGHYVNANQVYFESRRDVADEQRHAALTWRIERTEVPYQFAVEPGVAPRGELTLSVDLERDELEMRIALADGAKCEYLWRREAAQFRAEARSACATSLPRAIVLSEQQLWLLPNASAATTSPFRLHRARAFTCHADLPGVGGGRAIAYRRYDELALHDQGGSVWFTTDESPPRRLGISLLTVDWPINNYTGLYARDSLVIYVSEEADAQRIEHGYAFTVPEADRIGINLKWLLAMCYQTPNADAVPQF